MGRFTFFASLDLNLYPTFFLSSLAQIKRDETLGNGNQCPGTGPLVTRPDQGSERSSKEINSWNCEMLPVAMVVMRAGKPA